MFTYIRCFFCKKEVSPFPVWGQNWVHMSRRAEGAVVGCLLLDFQILWIFIERFHLESAMDFTKLSGRFEVLLWRDVFTIERNNMIERLRFINFIEG
jgi:hypothetical protein